MFHNSQRFVMKRLLILACLLPLGVAAKSNLIFILANDQGYGDVSLAGGLALTPHAKRLAKESISFPDAKQRKLREKGYAILPRETFLRASDAIHLAAAPYFHLHPVNPIAA